MHGEEHGRGDEGGGVVDKGLEAQDYHPGGLEARGPGGDTSVRERRGGRQDVPSGIQHRRPPVQEGAPQVRWHRLELQTWDFDCTDSFLSLSAAKFM